MSNLPLRDPVTGRFVSRSVKPQEPVVALAYTVIYVVCFCTFFLMIALAIFFLQMKQLKDMVIQNRELIVQIQEEGAALIVVPETVAPETRIPYMTPAPEIEADPVSDKEKPQRKVRVFRGSEVTEVNF